MLCLATLLALALSAAACGNDAPPPGAGEASATVKRYFNAISRGDAKAMCRELSPRARDDPSTTTPAERRKLERIASAVVEEMVREGRIKPR